MEHVVSESDHSRMDGIVNNFGYLKKEKYDIQ